MDIKYQCFNHDITLLVVLSPVCFPSAVVWFGCCFSPKGSCAESLRLGGMIWISGIFQKCGLLKRDEVTGLITVGRGWCHSLGTQVSFYSCELLLKDSYTPQHLSSPCMCFHHDAIHLVEIQAGLQEIEPTNLGLWTCSLGHFTIVIKNKIKIKNQHSS